MSRWLATACLFVVLAMLVTTGCSGATVPAGSGTLLVEPPSEHPPGADAASILLGATSLDEEVQFAVSLNLRDEDGLASFMKRLNDPASADFHRYVTAAEFGDRFGLPVADVDKVIAWLESGGLTASIVPQRTSIDATGSAAAVNRLLGVTLENWSTSDGRLFHRPSAAARVPASLNGKVATVLGLDTEPVLRPAVGHILASGVPADGLLPQTVAKAYEIEPLHDAGFHGEGQTVGIVSFDTFTPSDIDLFDQTTDIDAPPVEVVRLTGAASSPGPNTSEVALDIQVIRGIAPKAKIINYEAPNTYDGFAAVMKRIVADGDAKLVNISWGGCEKHSPVGAIRAAEREFAAAFAAGVSVFVASGDNGAFDCRGVQIAPDRFQRDLAQDADWPSTSTNAIGVGGTFLSIREDGTYINEVGWEDPLSGGGGGGGLSTLMDRPDWQVGDGVHNASSNGKRQVPDVAGPADPASGFFVIVTEGSGGPTLAKIGGTSAAAPFWVGSMALTAQMAAGEGVTSLGTLGPTLYLLAADQPAGAVFHDIIDGGNLLFEAGPGWDYSTGLGTPRVAPLARALVDFLKQ